MLMQHIHIIHALCNHTTTTHTYTSNHMYLNHLFIHIFHQTYVRQRIMYLPRSHIENTSQKHAKHTTNCNTAKSKACLTKPFEKTEITWSPYLGKLPFTTTRPNNTTRFLKQAAYHQYIVSQPIVLN